MCSHCQRHSVSQTGSISKGVDLDRRPLILILTVELDRSGHAAPTSLSIQQAMVDTEDDSPWRSCPELSASRPLHTFMRHQKDILHQQTANNSPFTLSLSLSLSRTQSPKGIRATGRTRHNQPWIEGTPSIRYDSTKRTTFCPEMLLPTSEALCIMYTLIIGTISVLWRLHLHREHGLRLYTNQSTRSDGMKNNLEKEVENHPFLAGSIAQCLLRLATGSKARPNPFSESFTPRRRFRSSARCL